MNNSIRKKLELLDNMAFSIDLKRVELKKILPQLTREERRVKFLEIMRMEDEIIDLSEKFGFPKSESVIVREQDFYPPLSEEQKNIWNEIKTLEESMNKMKERKGKHDLKELVGYAKKYSKYQGQFHESRKALRNTSVNNHHPLQRKTLSEMGFAKKDQFYLALLIGIPMMILALVFAFTLYNIIILQ